MWKNVYLKINVSGKNTKKETENAGKTQDPVILDRESKRVSLTSREVRHQVTLWKRNPVRGRSESKNRAVHTLCGTREAQKKGN